MASVDLLFTGQVTLSAQTNRIDRGPTSRRRDQRLKMNEEIAAASASGIRAPIIGYEVVDRREKFTVYKIHVQYEGRSWFVFRRYTDFARLNEKLKASFHGFYFKMPGKRWFKDNYEEEFIRERAYGLQLFINSVMHHSNISRSKIVKEFLCVDDPPGPFDSLEESRAYCQSLEYNVDDLKERIQELEAELSATKSQLAQARVQQEALVSSLNAERSSCVKHHSRSGGSPVALPGPSNYLSSTDTQTKSETSSHGKLELDEASDDEESPWVGKVELSAHSNGVKTPRKRPLTSTPQKSDNENHDIISSKCLDGNTSRTESPENINHGASESEECEIQDEVREGRLQGELSADKHSSHSVENGENKNYYRDISQENVASEIKQSEMQDEVRVGWLQDELSADKHSSHSVENGDNKDYFREKEQSEIQDDARDGLQDESSADKHSSHSVENAGNKDYFRDISQESVASEKEQSEMQDDVRDGLQESSADKRSWDSVENGESKGYDFDGTTTGHSPERDSGIILDINSPTSAM